MQYLHASPMTHVLVLVMHVLGSQEIMSVCNCKSLSPKTIKMNLISVEHGRSYPSSVDDLCSMSLLYWSLVFLS